MSSSTPSAFGASSSVDLRNEPLATASLICGILSWICAGFIAGIPAIICGHIARGRIARSGGTLGGGGLALAGLILGYSSTLLQIALVVLLLTVGVAALPFAKQGLSSGMSKANVVLLSTAVTAFKKDYGRLPLVPEGAKEDQRLENKALLAVLQARDTNANPRKVVFFETMATSINNGQVVDAWQTPLNIAVDANSDGRVHLDGLDVPGDAAVWSSGPNKQDEQGAGDDLPGWR